MSILILFGISNEDIHPSFRLQTSGSEWHRTSRTRLSAFSQELHSVEICSWCCYASSYAIKNQLKAPKATTSGTSCLYLVLYGHQKAGVATQ